MAADSRDWRWTLATVLLSSVGGGLSVNIVSGDYRWRSVTAAVALGLLVVMAAAVRRYPTSSILVRGIRRFMLSLASLTGLVALAGPMQKDPWSIGAAPALVAGVLLMVRSRLVGLSLLLSCCGVGAGLGCMGSALTALDWHSWQARGPMITGSALILSGFFTSIFIGLMRGIGLALLGVAVTCTGLAVASEQGIHPTGTALLGTGILVGWAGIFLTREKWSERFSGYSPLAYLLIALTMAAAACASVSLLSSHLAWRVIAGCLAVVLSALATAAPMAGELVLGICAIVAALPLSAVGVELVFLKLELFGLSVIGLAIAIAWAVVEVCASGPTRERLQQGWRFLVADRSQSVVRGSATAGD